MKPVSPKSPFCLSPEQRVEVARRSGTGRATVARWRERYVAEGLPVLDRDEPRSGRKRTTLTEAKVREIVDATRLTIPIAAAHWSLRTMAAHAGVAPSQVHEVWKGQRPQPHRLVW